MTRPESHINFYDRPELAILICMTRPESHINISRQSDIKRRSSTVFGGIPTVIPIAATVLVGIPTVFGWFGYLKLQLSHHVGTGGGRCQR